MNSNKSRINHNKLFIDDIRYPFNIGVDCTDFMIARNPFVAKQLIEQYKPQYICFDHDLGIDDNGNLYETGYDIAKWLVEKDLDDSTFITSQFKYLVHSANPVGKNNIESLLNNYIKQKFSEISFKND